MMKMKQKEVGGDKVDREGESKNMWIQKEG